MTSPKSTVYSIYFANISQDVVSVQKECVNRFLPPEMTFIQKCWEPNGEMFPHAAAMQHCVLSNENDLTIFLDIDCSPISNVALPLLAATAQNGALVGAVQRANHIDNGYHLYVGPFAMAFSKQKYLSLGSPTFNATERGDIAEELTYAWQNAGESIAFLWPSQVEQPVWNLYGDVQFGYGTTYENLFYHNFCIRDPQTQKKFVEHCKMFLNRAEKREGVLV